jgi:hypothetical protein
VRGSALARRASRGAGEFKLAGLFGYCSGVNWQRANIQAAVTYLRERISNSPSDTRARIVYEGLLEVLDPKRRDGRLQREMLAATHAGIPVAASRERRTVSDRRAVERRRVNLGSPNGGERRAGRERRTGNDRRK